MIVVNVSGAKWPAVAVHLEINWIGTKSPPQMMANQSCLNVKERNLTREMRSVLL